MQRDAFVVARDGAQIASLKIRRETRGVRREECILGVDVKGLPSIDRSFLPSRQRG